MQNNEQPSFIKIMLFMAIFVLVGFPLVGYLWETLNELLSLQVNPRRLLISIPVLLVFAGLLTLLSRSIKRMLGST